MARLSKAEVKRHNEAEALLKLDRLNDDQRQFVLDNWNEGATHMNSAHGAFFTPSDLALDAALMGGCNICSDCDDFRVIDLCAGIGCLGLAAWWRTNKRAQVTCVEKNPDYVAIGKKLFPEARWICGSVDQLPADIGRFDVALANPPFGKLCKIKGPRYSGEDELAVIDIASTLARMGCFILPQMSCPFAYSGQQFYRRRHSEKFERFHRATGIEVECESIDTSYFAEGWRGVKPNVEVVTCDFEQVPLAEIAPRAPLALVAAAASPAPAPVRVAQLDLFAA